MKLPTWFKPYKFVFVPISWPGWLLFFSFVVLTVLNFMRVDAHSHSASDTLLNFVPETVIAAAIFYLVCVLFSAKKG